MKRIKACILIILCILTRSVTTQAQNTNSIIIDKDIQLERIGDSVFIHISWHESDDYGRFPSNGLVLIRQGKALLVDTPMDNDKTERLCNFLEDSLGAETELLIAGHFHNDCLGGLEYLQEQSVESLANSLTVEICKQKGLPVPSHSFTDSLGFDFHGEKIVCRYPGAGHSKDNITVWLPMQQILFGGCLVKSMHSRGLGNLSDAVVDEWDITIIKLMQLYPDVQTVIPGHGASGGQELLSHSLDLIKKEKAEN